MEQNLFSFYPSVNSEANAITNPAAVVGTPGRILTLKAIIRPIISIIIPVIIKVSPNFLSFILIPPFFD